MKKLNVTMTFSGAADKVYTFPGVDKRELSAIERAGLTALLFMGTLSDVESLIDAGEPSADGRQDLLLSFDVVEDKKGDEHNSAQFTWRKMDRQAVALLIAAFDDQFLKAGIKSH